LHTTLGIISPRFARADRGAPSAGTQPPLAAIRPGV
jgi:hypothetical protein